MINIQILLTSNGDGLMVQNAPEGEAEEEYREFGRLIASNS